MSLQTRPLIQMLDEDDAARIKGITEPETPVKPVNGIRVAGLSFRSTNRYLRPSIDVD